MEGRKKTFAEKLFANKENRPDNHLVVGYQVRKFGRSHPLESNG